MIQLIKWGEPMHTSSRIYQRGSINLPKSQIVDIMLLNNDSLYDKIGEAKLIENADGLFVDNVNYFIDEKSLDSLQQKEYKIYKKYYPDDIYYSGLTIACLGNNYIKKVGVDNPVEFKFLYRHLLTKGDIKDIIRDLKIKHLIQ